VGSIGMELPPVDQAMVLRLQGARGGLLRTSNGDIRQGLHMALEPGQGGYLTVDHGIGWVVARLEPASSTSSTPSVSPAPGQLAESFGFPADRSIPTARRIQAPAVVDLSAGGRLDIEIPTEAVLHLRAAEALVTSTRRSGDPSVSAGAHLEGLELDLPVSAGVTELQLRRLGGSWNGALSGQLEVYTSPVTDLGEGLGPERLLRPGETRFYRLQIDRQRSIGLGVHADADDVDGSLINAQGEVLGRGAVQMHDLEPGVYLFALSLGSGKAPVRARPAVAGLEAPGTGPPREVVERYLKLAERGSAVKP